MNDVLSVKNDLSPKTSKQIREVFNCLSENYANATL